MGRSLNNSHSSLLANPTVVSSISTDGGTRHITSAIESPPQTTTVTKNRAETSVMEKTATNSGTFVRCFQMEGLLSGVSEATMASWRPGTKGIYNRTVQRWLGYCRRRGYHTQHPTAGEVLDFLHALFAQGLGYSAINSHRSALSSIGPGVGRIGEHNLVSRFMKGVFNLRPPQPRCSKIYLNGLGRNEDLTLRQLTLKTAMVLSVLAGRRLHTLHKLGISKMDISDVGRKVICHITGLTKCSKPSRPNKPIVFCAYTENELFCPVACIKEYLHFRAGLVDEKCTQLFITHGKPHHPISKDTLAHWVKEVMVCAGIDVTIFKPHSTRGASTSKAFHLEISLSDILKQGQWSNAKTFFNFYCREIEEEDGSET